MKVFRYFYSSTAPTFELLRDLCGGVRLQTHIFALRFNLNANSYILRGMPKKELPTWDLSHLYKGLEDPRIKADLQALAEQAKSFQSAYQEEITEKIAATTLKKALEEYALLLQGTRRLEAYAYLEYATKTTSPKHRAFLQKTTARTTDIASHVLFFEVALTKLPTNTLASFINNQILKEYRHFLEKQREQKLHRLSVEGEEIVLKKSLTSKHAFNRLYQERSTSQTYQLTRHSKKRLTISELMSLGRSPHRSKRQAAARARHQAHNNDPLHHTFTYNTLVQDWGIDTKLRKFEHPENMRHIENEITRPIVNALVDTVVKNYPLVHNYYRFKQQLLGLPQLYDYDKYAPLKDTSKQYSFREAKEIILNAFEGFSPQFSSIALKFFEEQWIDASPSISKQAGAFCHYCTPDTHPYVMVNYTNTPDDVSILAHELGHGIHAYLVRNQNILNFDWPITIAETASVFAEMLTFESLKRELKTPKDKLALYLSKIENIFATIPRQIAMFRFERHVHHLYDAKGELTTKQLNAIWVEEQQAMFGNSISLTEYEQSYWQMIPHIFRSPFYVYSYAFGELLTLSLFAVYKDDPRKFVPKYVELLSMGGSKSPQELVKPFGIDLSDQQFWQKGIGEITQLINEAQELAQTSSV